MYSKEDLKRQIAAMGIQPWDTLLVHSSMKTIGPVEGEQIRCWTPSANTWRKGCWCCLPIPGTGLVGSTAFSMWKTSPPALVCSPISSANAPAFCAPGTPPTLWLRLDGG